MLIETYVIEGVTGYGWLDTVCENLSANQFKKIKLKISVV
jgi:hypothetical protein